MYMDSKIRRLVNQLFLLKCTVWFSIQSFLFSKFRKIVSNLPKRKERKPGKLDNLVKLWPRNGAICVRIGHFLLENGGYGPLSILSDTFIPNLITPPPPVSTLYIVPLTSIATIETCRECLVLPRNLANVSVVVLPLMSINKIANLIFFLILFSFYY